MNASFYAFARGLLRGLFGLFSPVSAEGLEHVPETGAAVLCGNHQSLTDPILVCCALKRPVAFMAKKELFAFKPLGALLNGLGAFPVDRGGRDLGAVRRSLAILKEGGALGIYPQGKRVFKGGGAYHTGAALIALRAGAPVIPMYLGARARLFRRNRLIFGPPVDLSDFGARLDSKALDEATARIERAVNALGGSGGAVEM